MHRTVNKCFLNQTTLDLRKGKWSSLNQDLPVTQNLKSKPFGVQAASNVVVSVRSLFTETTKFGSVVKLIASFKILQ